MCDYIYVADMVPAGFIYFIITGRYHMCDCIYVVGMVLAGYTIFNSRLVLDM